MGLFNFLVSKTIMYIPSPIVYFFGKGYIAGQTLYDAVRVTRELNKKNIMATIDILGEAVTKKEEATFFKNECIKVLSTIDKEGLNANLSLKPTQMGLEIDRDFALNNIKEIVSFAKDIGNFVRIDMEDSKWTDDTLLFYKELREEFPGNVGTVLQSYLRRTPKDIDSLSDGLLNFRLCKGIYNEPRKIAYKDPYIINQNFIYSLDKMFQKGAYVGIATHDEKLIFESLRLIEKYGLKKEDYEFQMLLGVDEELRDIIVSAGHRLRVYVPFGQKWLAYSRRRLKENPNIAKHALRQFLHLQRHT